MHNSWILLALAAVGSTTARSFDLSPRQAVSGSASSGPVSSAPASAAPSSDSSAAPSSAPASSAASSEPAPSSAAAAPAASSVPIAWPISSAPLASSTPLTNAQQVGNSAWGSLPQRTFPQWIDTPAGQPYAKAPWGDKTTTNSDAMFRTSIPNTNVTRHYDFTISRGLLSPDGVLRNVILINGQFPGPLIQANWGDWIEVTVHNAIKAPEEGTSMHWHGMLQYGTQWEDGIPGVSQCPIAPGSSQTYRFRAELYGTSLYHAHYSAQYTAGVVGPFVVYGPTQMDYDIDLGPVLLSDWNHIPYFSMVQNVMTWNMTTKAPTSDSGLINGRGRFNCEHPSYGSNSTDWLASNLPSKLKWTCVDGAKRAQFQFQRGKVHRLRLVNTGGDGIHKFSIDGHTMTVIATDFVPVTPYTTNSITLGVGQRTDVLVTAGGESTSSYWMRSEILDAATCGGLAPPGTNNIPILAEIYYENADTSVEPTSTASVSSSSPSCNNDALNTTQPEYAQTPSELPFYQDLILSLEPNATGSYEWQINGQAFQADYNTPLLYEIEDGQTSFPDDPQWNVYNFGSNTSIVLNITNTTPLPHPIHMHGHNFYVLSVGTVPGQVWDGSVVNPSNPMRRDVEIMPPLGYVAVQFEGDNPGVWPLHCHTAWHLSAGWYINIVSQPDQIAKFPAGQRASTCDAWQSWTNGHVVDQIDSGT